MENYKRLLKQRIWMYISVIIGSIALIIKTVDRINIRKETGDFLDGMVEGIQMGLLTALTGIFIFMIVKYLRALKSERQLKMCYNSEHDERKMIIKQKAGGNIMLSCIVIIVFAAIIAGYYNKTVFLSLLACGFVQMQVMSVAKLYYRKKY